MRWIGKLYGVDIWQNPTFNRDEAGEFREKYIGTEDIECLHKAVLELIRQCDMRMLKLKSIEVK